MEEIKIKRLWINSKSYPVYPDSKNDSDDKAADTRYSRGAETNRTSAPNTMNIVLIADGIEQNNILEYAKKSEKAILTAELADGKTVFSSGVIQVNGKEDARIDVELLLYEEWKK